MRILPLLLPLPATYATCPTHPFQNQCPYPPHPYTVAPSPGKGLGVFAAHNLELGTIIMREAPILTITPATAQDVLSSTSPPTISQLVHAEYARLSEVEKHAILELTYSVLPADLEKYNGKLDILGLIFRNNAYNTGDSIGLFPRIARINHSCKPNAAYYWNEKQRRRMVYATREIEAGEEIYVSFISLLLPREERRRKLARYGFTCVCDACTQAPVAQAQSDAAREDIAQALQAFSAQMNLTAPTAPGARAKARKNAEASLVLKGMLEEEGLAEYYAQVYRIVAISHARIEDWERATVWANEGYKRRVMEDAESGWTVEMGELVRRFVERWEAELMGK